MAISFSYWDDCVDPQNFEAMWNVPEVSAEWIKAGEQRCQKVHLSRDPDGQPYLTQTEMRAVADIIITKHFHSEIDPDMICAIAELESDRQLLVMNSRHKSKEPTVGLMQLLPKTTEWLMRKRSEEFIVRAYKGGTKKATHKSTLRYWNCYLSVKESFRSRKSVDDNVSPPAHSHPLPSLENSKDASVDTYWDSRVAPEDMEAMWNHLEVRKEWNKSKQKQGKVRFAHDEKKRPYLSRVEMKAIADIILYKYLSTVKIKSTVICAIGEVLSKRFLHGVGEQPGIMGIDYSTAYWLYLELGYRAYRLESVDDLNNPFVSMYFGAAYVAWLSEYEGRERPPDFFVQAYFVGPKNVNPQDTSTLWLKFEETLSKYEETKRY
ncbi:hypothetical protein glysoja_026584 [Glycine soja]|uniref:Transglycosylase SLT domain-containing protein n=1 Tax=Glycine soja TaxID=3848 RepID=A0A0B2QNA1_GLYSO|nr:hypothetical protein glysoja_026584 [Glycine soja]